jgi:hypothetical protein
MMFLLVNLLALGRAYGTTQHRMWIGVLPYGSSASFVGLDLAIASVIVPPAFLLSISVNRHDGLCR